MYLNTCIPVSERDSKMQPAWTVALLTPNTFTSHDAVIYKLKTNRHYGMIGSIPPQDIPWSQKKNQAIFRGTLTGLLPSGSRFSLSTRNQHAQMLQPGDAEEKCLQLDRCRLVYQVNRFYESQTPSIEQLVDAKLVLPQLQHTDIPQDIGTIGLFGNRMTKQDLLGYKAIVLLEGNDAGTGFKWGLFSNSVVMTSEKLNFTSWAMEELLEPWLHYIPLDPSNFEEDVHNKMQWVLDHDQEAQEIARRGSLWIRDLLIHPEAQRDDEKISDDMVRRYMAHFVRDDDMESSFTMLDLPTIVEDE
jgi:Glycosyl transferase family 90